MNHPDLFSVPPEPNPDHRRLPTPSVEESPTSVARAIREDDNGTAKRRRRDVLNHLNSAGPNGLTWQELGKISGLHHGQASGCLSTLHKAGLVFAIADAPRNGCQPYVHACYRDLFPAHRRHDTPVTTKAGRRRASLEDLAEALDVYLAFKTEANWQKVIAAHDALQ